MMESLDGIFETRSRGTESSLEAMVQSRLPRYCLGVVMKVHILKASFYAFSLESAKYGPYLSQCSFCTECACGMPGGNFYNRCPS
jgi:hypothetical protein